MYEACRIFAGYKLLVTPENSSGRMASCEKREEGRGQNLYETPEKIPNE